MKNTAIFTAILILLALGQSSFGQAVKETPATIGLAKGGNPQGVIQGSSAQGIIFSSVSGQKGKLIPFSAIRGKGLDKLIRVNMRAEALSPARSLFAEGKYREAAGEYGKVANAFGILLSIPQNFAVEARFFQIESLRRAGSFSEIAALLETPAGKAIPTLLGKSYQSFHVMNKLWALYGSKKMDELKAAIAGYQVAVDDKTKLLREPNFKEMPSSELVQLAFLRAKLYSAAGEKEKALDDYYRVITLTLGNDAFLAKQSMGAAMVIQKANPKLAAKDKKTLHQMQSLAFLFKNTYGALPPAFQEFAVRPDVPRPKPAPKAAPAPAPKAGDKKAPAAKKPAAKKPAPAKKK